MGEVVSYPRPELRIVSEKDAAKMLGISADTLRRMRLADIGPRWVQTGVRRIGYRVASVEQWVVSQERGSGGSSVVTRAAA